MTFESEDRRIPESRSRMISFRVKEEEFQRFRQLCLQKGVRNLSEVVLLDVNQMLVEDKSTDGVPAERRIASRLENLESRMAHLDLRLARNQIASTRVAMHASNQ